MADNGLNRTQQISDERPRLLKSSYRLVLLGLAGAASPLFIGPAKAQTADQQPFPDQPAAVEPYGVSDYTGSRYVSRPYGGAPSAALPTGNLAQGIRPLRRSSSIPVDTDGDKSPDATAAPSPNLPPWIITPYISAREAYTDNARLTPNGSSDFVTSLSPGIAVQGRTPHLRVAFDGNLTYDLYARSRDLDGFRYNVSGNALGEVIKDTLFFDARSSISLEQLNANGVASALERSLPGNQTQVVNTSISPYLAHDFGNWASGQIRYRASFIDYSNANTNSFVLAPTPAGGLAVVNPNSSTSHQISANIHAGPRFTTFRWAFDVSAGISDFSTNRTVEERSVTATGEYAFNRELAALLKVGGDQFKDSTVANSDTFHPSVRAGGRYSPGPRTDFLVEGGARFGGPYWSGIFRYRISRTITLTASHTETLTTQQGLTGSSLNELVRDEQGHLTDPLTGQPTNPNISPFDFTNQSFSLKTSRIALSGVTERNFYSVSLEHDERNLGATRLGQSGTQQQTSLSVGASVGRQLSRLSSLTLSLSLGKTDDSAGTGGHDILRAGVTYNYTFLPTLHGSVGYARYSLSNKLGTGYDENALFISARKSF